LVLVDVLRGIPLWQNPTLAQTVGGQEGGLDTGLALVAILILDPPYRPSSLDFFTMAREYYSSLLVRNGCGLSGVGGLALEMFRVAEVCPTMSSFFGTTTISPFDETPMR